VGMPTRSRVASARLGGACDACGHVFENGEVAVVSRLFTVCYRPECACRGMRRAGVPDGTVIAIVRVRVGSPDASCTVTSPRPRLLGRRPLPDGRTEPYRLPTDLEDVR
jgi:hypothetical protein